MNPTKKEACAVVMGGYVNGYGVIRELHSHGIGEIILFDEKISISCFSKHITEKRIFVLNEANLLLELKRLHEIYDKIILYPTHDNHIEWLIKLSHKIQEYCFLPFNLNNIQKYLSKAGQLSFCIDNDIPHPRTIVLKSLEDIVQQNFQFPVILKPTNAHEGVVSTSVFRNMVLNSPDEIPALSSKIQKYIDNGIDILASEYIIGNDNNIYAYVAYRSKSGKTLGEWCWRKLSQFPENTGVFSTACNYYSSDLLMLGRKIGNGMSIEGMFETEFKYDDRDGKYKYIETNYRPIMLNRLGYLSGVNLAYCQFQDALALPVVSTKQILDKEIHFVYLKHELLNLIIGKQYLQKFIYNVFKSDKTYFAVFDIHDIKPVVMDFVSFVISILKKMKKKVLSQLSHS